MRKVQQALVLTTAIAVQGLTAPVAAMAADPFTAQTLLPKSASTAQCQRRGGGGGGHNVRTTASSNVNRNVNANRNTNVNVNRNVNVNVDHSYGYRDGWDHHPIAAGVAFGTAAAVTAAAVGSIVYSVPPSCSTVIVNGVSYSQCGATWYAPRYYGSTVQYVVVNPPG